MWRWTGSFDVVDVGDEVLDPALVVELDALAAGALVGERDPQAARQERRLAQALARASRAENSSSSKISASGRNEIVVPVSVADADRLHVALRDAAGELLAVDLAVALDLGDEPLRERVHDRDADAVQAAGDLVALAAELAAGVELRQHDRQRREARALDDRRPGCRGRGRRP